MIQKKYENLTKIKIITVLLIIIQLIFILLMTNYKVYKDKTLTCIVMNKNICLLILDDKEKELLHKNMKLYVNNKENTFKIIEDNNVVVTNGKKKYKEILIKVDLVKSYKTNDTVKLTIRERKIKLIEIFKVILEGD